MSIWSTARRKAVFPVRAFSSGNVVREPTSSHSVNLSPEKMRALIAMYHQAETFVTRENLMEKIDEAFTKQPNTLTMNRVSLSIRDFDALLSRRKEAPTVTEWNPGDTVFDPIATTNASEAGGRMSIWSTVGVARDSKVIEALYGVESLGAGRALPGLEALEDAADLLERSAKEDRERDGYEDSDF